MNEQHPWSNWSEQEWRDFRVKATAAEFAHWNVSHGLTQNWPAFIDELREFWEDGLFDPTDGLITRQSLEESLIAAADRVWAEEGQGLVEGAQHLRDMGMTDDQLRTLMELRLNRRRPQPEDQP